MYVGRVGPRIKKIFACNLMFLVLEEVRNRTMRMCEEVIRVIRVVRVMRVISVIRRIRVIGTTRSSRPACERQSRGREERRKTG